MKTKTLSTRAKGVRTRLVCLLIFITTAAFSSMADTRASYRFTSLGEDSVQAIFNVQSNADKIWVLLTDYKNSHKYLPIVERTSILHREKDTTLVKTIVKWGPLRMTTHSRITALREKLYIKWNQLKGPFTKNSGSWQLKPLSGNLTKVIYTVNLNHPLMPSSMHKSLIEKSIPNLCKSIQAYSTGQNLP